MNANNTRGFASDNNSHWLTIEQIEEIVAQIEVEQLESQVA